MKKLSALFLLLATFALFTSAQSASSQSMDVQASTQASPATQQFQARLAAFNSGDRTTLQQYLQKNRPSSLAHLDDELAFRQQTGGFEFKKSNRALPLRSPLC